MTTVYLSHPNCAKHNMGEGHPESPRRVAAIHDALIAQGVMDLLTAHQAPIASREQLVRVHDKEYIDEITQSSPEQGMVALDPDTFMNPFTLDAALRAAGAVVKATELVLEGKATNAFCNVRPPGHHAEHNKAMGFCFFNNVAVGVAHALQEYYLKKIAVIDFDVHHGNGTEDIFQKDARVLMCQTYQSPFYPFTGGGSAAGHLLNTPLSAGTNSEAFRAAVTTTWLPQLHKFKPEMIFISAGFDAHMEDPLAQINLNECDFSWVTEEVKTVAKRYCQGRIVSSLEGGYNTNALGRSAVAHIKALLVRENYP